MKDNGIDEKRYFVHEEREYPLNNDNDFETPIIPSKLGEAYVYTFCNSGSVEGYKHFGGSVVGSYLEEHQPFIPIEEYNQLSFRIIRAKDVHPKVGTIKIKRIS